MNKLENLKLENEIGGPIMKLFTENDILELMKEFEVASKVNVTFVAVDEMLEPITMIHSTTCYLDGHIQHVYELEMFGSTILAIDGLVSKTYVAGLMASSVNYILQKVEKYNEKKEKKESGKLS